MKQLTFSELEVKKEIHRIRKDPVTQMQLVRYAGASGDFNPIHNDRDFAQEQGLDGTIAHGMLIMGMLGQLLTEISDPSFVKNLEVKFANMTKPGESLELSASVKKLEESNDGNFAIVAVQASGPEGDVKAKGEAKILCS